MQNLLSSRLLSKNLNIRIDKTIILLVVLYGCETWPLIFREKYRLEVFENRVLRRRSGLKSDEVTGEWIKLHNEVLYDLYSSPGLIRIINYIRSNKARLNIVVKEGSIYLFISCYTRNRIHSPIIKIEYSSRGG
jgi:hypothetical protein